MHATDLSKISADSHVDEPHDLWFERLRPDLRDRAPRRIQAESDGGWTLVVDDSPLGWSDVSAEQAAAHAIAARTTTHLPEDRTVHRRNWHLCAVRVMRTARVAPASSGPSLCRS